MSAPDDMTVRELMEWIESLRVKVALHGTGYILTPRERGGGRNRG